jgi:hypothetical protein
MFPIKTVHFLFSVNFHLTHFERPVSVQNDEIFLNICRSFQRDALQVQKNIYNIFNPLEYDT